MSSTEASKSEAWASDSCTGCVLDELVYLRDVDVVVPVGPNLRAIDLGDDPLRASDEAPLVPEVPAEAAVTVGVGGRCDDHEHVHWRHVAEVGRIALELGGEDHGDVVDDAAVEGRAAHLPEDLLDGHGERVAPAWVEPTGVFDGSVAGYQDVLKFVAARGKGVD